MQIITLDTGAREVLIDITPRVAEVVAASQVKAGLCHLWCYHTTAALTINENADPDVKTDLLMALERIVGYDWPYQHAEDNSPAHVKSSLLGCQLTIPVNGGKLELGRWQGIIFAEFDGPRQGRRVSVSIINSGG
ncbi:YjbQ family protein [bacterium]|nr:YjbQ family protein [bacterium]